jgi:hypothetical protein
MAEVDDFHRDTLLAHLHDQRGDHERGLEIVADKSLFHFREGVEPHGFIRPFPTHLLVDEVGHGAGQVSGNRKKTDAKLLRARILPVAAKPTDLIEE